VRVQRLVTSTWSTVIILVGLTALGVYAVVELVHGDRTGIVFLIIAVLGLAARLSMIIVIARRTALENRGTGPRRPPVKNSAWRLRRLRMYTLGWMIGFALIGIVGIILAVTVQGPFQIFGFCLIAAAIVTIVIFTFAYARGRRAIAALDAPDPEY
jgi:hypothetical protein